MIPKSLNQVSQILSTLGANLAAQGDPLGFKEVYWTDWAQELGLARQGSDLLFTARMYQMLPYAMEASRLSEKARTWLSLPGAAKVMDIGNRLAGERIVRGLAGKQKTTARRGKDALCGIARALTAVGRDPWYLYEQEPYTGALMHDLGLEDQVGPHAQKVERILKNADAANIITVDPHSAYMLQQVYPQYLSGCDLAVSHYLDILVQEKERLSAAAQPLPMQEMVVHDSCVLVRELGLDCQLREVAAALGLELREPENSRENTACCGGPIEYAFADLTEQVSRLRAEELSREGSQVLVTCPICLINLARHEQELGLRVWDLGELLGLALSSGG
ncbi:MAG: (Fe-S)-binding protein [Desulfarculaceae bacterium]